MSEVCLCSPGADPGCRICNPDKWKEYAPNCWRKRSEGEMSEMGAKEQEMKNMGQEANAGRARDDSTTTTRLLDKHWSPLIVRKYQMEGWPLFISLICDANLNDLDKIIYEIHDQAIESGFVNGTIQGSRNYCGFMSDKIKEHYDVVKRGCVEGVAVLWYVDKCFISSLYGDFMVHASCKQELFAIINTLPHI